jgi:hypothetical protein
MWRIFFFLLLASFNTLNILPVSEYVNVVKNRITGSILIRILTGPLSVAFYDTHKEMWRTYSISDPHGTSKALSAEPFTCNCDVSI